MAPKKSMPSRAAAAEDSSSLRMDAHAAYVAKDSSGADAANPCLLYTSPSPRDRS